MEVPSWAVTALVGSCFLYRYMKEQRKRKGVVAKDITEKAKKRAREAAKLVKQSKEEEEEEKEEEEEEEEEDSEDSFEEMKMVLVVRKDLKMGTGKMCAQCCHATLGVVERIYTTTNNDTWMSWYRTWSRRGCTKIAVKANSEKDLVDVQSKARALNVPTYLVRDAGRTQIEAGSKTVISVGPAPISKVDELCSHFKLL
eukprot:TRINITY_DN1416_c0_g1_i1.p1 TRINITY_DN1416_c0_g1~~TRINITY_DN1416_c0_g1_i1.p1  ORF type:complete len:215 (+),score=59.50 TRINITY_DN1416_c0_g1_i1:50-646(+)